MKRRICKNKAAFSLTEIVFTDGSDLANGGISETRHVDRLAKYYIVEYKSLSDTATSELSSSCNFNLLCFYRPLSLYFYIAMSNLYTTNFTDYS